MMGYWAIHLLVGFFVNFGFRVTEGQNQIYPAKFGSLKVRTKLGTAIFGFGYFGFGSGYYGLVLVLG